MEKSGTGTKAVLLGTALTVDIKKVSPSLSTTLPFAPADWIWWIFSLQFCCPALRLKPVVVGKKVLKAPCRSKFSPRVLDSCMFTWRIWAFL